MGKGPCLACPEYAWVHSGSQEALLESEQQARTLGEHRPGVLWSEDRHLAAQSGFVEELRGWSRNFFPLRAEQGGQFTGYFLYKSPNLLGAPRGQELCFLSYLQWDPQSPARAWPTGQSVTGVPPINAQAGLADRSHLQSQ